MTFTADENGVYQDTLVYNAETDTPILFHYHRGVVPRFTP